MKVVSGTTADRTAPHFVAVSLGCADEYDTACTGDAWDLTGDRPAHCTCACHDAA